MKYSILYFAFFALVASSNAQEFDGTLTADIIYKWGYTTDILHKWGYRTGTTYMQFGDRGIQRIDPTAFRTFTSLQYLSLAFNQLTSLVPGVLKDSTSLIRLDLHHSQLTSFSTDNLNLNTCT